MADKLFFHECRANGQVFKTSEDWTKYLRSAGMNVTAPVAEHFGFKYTINDICVNPHFKAGHMIDSLNFFEVKTARTQYGWIYGCGFKVGNDGFGCPVGYPSRYDNTPYFETEKEAVLDGLSFIIRQIEAKPRYKFTKILLYYAKKQKAYIENPQTELFNNQNQ